MLPVKAVDNFGIEYSVVKKGDLYVVERKAVKNEIEYLDFLCEEFCACGGEEGYYIIADVNRSGSRLVRFRDRENGTRIFKQILMPIIGVKNKNGAFLVIAEGCKSEINTVYQIRNNKYYIYPRFVFNREVPYEDVSIRIIELQGNADYSDMAVQYRKYKLNRKECTPLKKRIEYSSELKYAVESPEIRIRLGWKPAPPKVLEQTPDNEPQMHAACTFDRVCDIIEKLKEYGVEKAQLCLVGWNKSGHDGRWPQMFPVEERLGGEKDLIHLIEYSKDNGYQIVCHTNSTDCYSIADTFSDDIVVKNRDDSLKIDKLAWSGGRMYNLCPVKALEYAERDLPRISRLGFRGLHYVDVMTCIAPYNCYDKNHPANSEQTVEIYKKIMKMSHDLFGGFASEGAGDFAAEYLDYALYVAFPKSEDEMLDEEIPLWEIVYHGIVLYNPTTDTVNYPVKSEYRHLKLLEYGGRPSFYFYSKFMVGGSSDDWLGKEDMICDTDEQLKSNVEKIANAYNEYKKLSHLQYDFIEKHIKLENGVYKTTYSDGTSIIVNYNDNTFKIDV